MLSTTKMSTRGQIVIPENIRDQLGLISGTEFLIVAEEDAIILKQIHLPPKNLLKSLLDKANAKAKAAGVTEEAIATEIKKFRKVKKKT
jgi:AbrB family looped-hinge helix DNA binding protein